MICHKQNYGSLPKVRVTQKVKQNDNLCPVQDSGSMAVFKVTARDQRLVSEAFGAFVTYCTISCLQFGIPRWLPSALTKNSTKYEIDKVSITAEWIVIKFVSK